MVFIVHRVEDLTEFVRAALVAVGDDEDDASLRQEVLSRSRELRAANLKLGEYQSQLKMVQRLLKVAVWRLDLDTEEMHRYGSEHVVWVRQAVGRSYQAVYSEPGEGTTVKLYFPRSFDEATAMPEPRRNAVAQGQNEHIVVVEDDTLVRDQVVALLEGMGYVATSAASDADAMRIIQGDEAIDLLCNDVIMPGGMNGRQLAEAACALRPGLRVLFTSGYTENAIVHHGRLDPGVQLLSKP